MNDLGLLASNWQAGVGSALGSSFAEAAAALGLPSAAVPEPATLAAVLTGAALTALKPTARSWAFTEALSSFGLPSISVPEPAALGLSFAAALTCRRRTRTANGKMG